MKQEMKIIFLCKYNAFRSKVAESYFNRINKNKKVKAISRGFIMGGNADVVQRKVAKRFGTEIKGKPKSITLNELEEADKIIVVAGDIPKIMFDYQLSPLIKKVEFWGIKDEQKKNQRNVEKIVNRIIKKVNRLVKRMDKRELK